MKLGTITDEVVKYRIRVSDKALFFTAGLCMAFNLNKRLFRVALDEEDPEKKYFYLVLTNELEKSNQNYKLRMDEKRRIFILARRHVAQLILNGSQRANLIFTRRINKNEMVYLEFEIIRSF